MPDDLPMDQVSAYREALRTGALVAHDGGPWATTRPVVMTPPEMPDTLHTKGPLPPYLARIQAHNDAHLRWLLLGRLVKALLAGHTVAHRMRDIAIC